MATPAWRSQLRPASFRGVAFETRTRTLEGGRRIAHHVYPGRDEAYPEDMGRKPRAFSVEAHLIGPTYLERKKQLLAALEAQGPGEYVDRWAGPLTVQVKDFTVAENQGELGWAVFRITFVEWAPPGVHTVRPDDAARTRAAADKANGTARRAFEDAVQGKLRLFGLTAAQIRGVADTLRGLLAARRTRGGVVRELAARAAAFPDRAAGYASVPGGASGFAAALAALIGAVMEALPAGAPQYSAARTLAQGSGPASGSAPAGTTLVSRAEMEEAARVAALVRALAAAHQARATADMSFATYDDAVALRAEVAADLDAVMMDAPDAVYRDLGALRAAAVADITARGADLTRLTDVVPAATMPALVLAHSLYGDAGREADLLTRNRIRHPGFVPGGRPLKVPADG